MFKILQKGKRDEKNQCTCHDIAKLYANIM